MGWSFSDDLSDETGFAGKSWTWGRTNSSEMVRVPKYRRGQPVLQALQD